HVLFVGPPVESTVPERARARIHGARGLKVKLRELPAIERQRMYVTFVHIRPESRGTGVDRLLLGGHDRDALCRARRAERQIERERLACEQADVLALGG